jgi:hypothetical protein
MSKLIETMNQLQGHGLCRIIAKTEIKLLKKGRTSKLPLPERFQGLTRYYQIVASVGHSYSKGVQNQIRKAGGDSTLWVDEECKYSERDPESKNGIVRRHREKHDQKYLRYFPRLMGDTRGKSFYLNGKGEEISLNEITPEIEAEFFPKDSGPSLKQSEVMAAQEIGLEKEVEPRNLKEENLLYLKRGEVTYTGDISEDILGMFTFLNDGECPVAC